MSSRPNKFRFKPQRHAVLDATERAFIRERYDYDFEQREAARKAARAAARSVFFARHDRFVADGRH